MLQNAPNCTFICDETPKKDPPYACGENLRDQIYSLERVYFFENGRKKSSKKVQKWTSKKIDLADLADLPGSNLAR